jgi:hypothetical protein
MNLPAALPRIVGAKLPLRPMHVWTIRVRLQIERRVRDLALFDIALDSKLRGCDVGGAAAYGHHGGWRFEAPGHDHPAKDWPPRAIRNYTADAALAL